MAYILSDKETINMLESTISQLKSANPKLKTVGNIPYRLFDVSVHETIALAAQSIDLEIHGWFDDPETEAFWADVGDTDVFPWNPMTHYQDAKGLAKQLGITVEELPDQGRTIATLGAHSVAMSHGRDWQYPQRAYCLAVTRVAAMSYVYREKSFTGRSRMNAPEYDYESRLLALYAIADLRGDTAAGWLFDTEYKQAEFEAYRARQSMDRLKRAILECDTPATPEIKVMFMSEFPRRVFYASYEAVDEVDNHTRNNPCQWCHDIARSEQ